MGKSWIAAAALTLAAVQSHASVSVVGGGLGRECFLAAERGNGSRDGLAMCDRALSEETLRPGDRAATLVNRGIVRMQAKDLTAAIADFDAALRLRPETAEAYVNKGIALVNLGGHDKDAVDVLSEGIARSPARPEVAYYIRGIANEQIGAMRAAFEDYSRAASLKPEWAEPGVELQRFTIVRKKTAQG